MSVDALAGHLADAVVVRVTTVPTADLVDGGFGVRFPVSLCLGFVSVQSVWTHLRF